MTVVRSVHVGNFILDNKKLVRIIFLLSRKERERVRERERERERERKKLAQAVMTRAA